MSVDNDDLAALRQRIDGIDDQILELVSERARLAEEVARAKARRGEALKVYRPEREAEILRRLVERNRGPLTREQVTVLFREVMSACRALQQPLTVAFLGPQGTFTEEAASKHFGHDAGMSPQATIGGVFREVESGAAHYGVVPVENSSEGVVSHTLDRFLDSELAIVGEVELRIHHALASHAGGLTSVERVYSHQQGLSQCRAWLETHLPQAERHPVSSTAEAARLAALEPNAAAIASEAAAERYGVPLLQERIEDYHGNTTRFLVLGYQSPPPSGHDKTSLVVSSANRSGLLFQLLEPLARNGIDMTRIESRPARQQGVWEYVFFIDILGHAGDEHLRGPLEEMRQRASLFRVLGSYPRAI
ncbi:MULTISPECIES: prephenate dehydratase [unclassified Halorhodospira]|uniref:prephenate dehydratase n=1 Tax=unclassified Halorhodospira TaxID=2626748 RepID=UPI001EE8F162|nr:MULTISPECIES: prephenate dehydratase [unclassified Halorhodospira]MCG5541174.1 prephenate dehydratase [Halorhodospira sp. M39old]MCG5545543.1 prephenate dehydratase [Halorhodospira sp. M38]